MKTNSIMDDIRHATPAEVSKQVDFSYAIANRVLELIEGKGMSQRDLARAIGKSETEVSRWLSGTHNLTLATIAKMAVALDDDIIMPTRSAKHYYGPNQSVSSTMVAESEVI